MKTKRFRKVVEYDIFHLVCSIVTFISLLIFFIISVFDSYLIGMHLSLILFLPVLGWSVYDYIESRKVYWEEVK